MKKRFLIAVAVLTGSITFAQKKVKQPPPPPPPPPSIAKINEVPPPPPPPTPAKNTDLSKEDQSFLQRNPNVKGISWSKNSIRIQLRSGKEEVYNLNSSEEVQKLKNKYGELPAPPPPPPPPPPKAPKEVI